MSTRRQSLHAGLTALPRTARQRTLLFRLMLAVSAQLRVRMDRALATAGVTTQQAMLLQIVSSAGAPTLGECARRLGTSHQNLKQLVLVLVRKKLLRMDPDPDDARVRRLRVTPRHRALVRARDDSDTALLTEWMTALTSADVQRLVRSLDRWHASLMEDDDTRSATR
jgi:DNA-binding MarR family transcriptional regulator